MVDANVRLRQFFFPYESWWTGIQSPCPPLGSVGIFGDTTNFTSEIHTPPILLPHKQNDAIRSTFLQFLLSILNWSINEYYIQTQMLLTTNWKFTLVLIPKWMKDRYDELIWWKIIGKAIKFKIVSQIHVPMPVHNVLIFFCLFPACSVSKNKGKIPLLQ